MYRTPCTTTGWYQPGMAHDAVTAAKGTDSFTQRLGYLEPKGNRIQAAFHVEVGEYDVEVISAAK